MPAPIPFDAPVTTATFPFNFPSFIICPSFFGFLEIHHLQWCETYLRGQTSRPASGHRSDLFPLPQNERCLILSNEVSIVSSYGRGKLSVGRRQRISLFSGSPDHSGCPRYAQPG